MAGRRGNHEGSVYYREARKRWEARLTVGHAENGKPIRRMFTGRTRKDAVAKMNEAKAALDQGLDAPDERATVAAFTEWWLDNVLPGEGLAPRTETFYRDILRTYVLPQVGAHRLAGPRALTPAHVQEMTAHLLARDTPKPHRVAEASRTALGKVLRAAEQRGLVGRNVARLARPPRDRGKARDVKSFSPGELAELLEALDAGADGRSRWYPVVVVGATTGLRPGELLALQWSDVHLDEDAPYLSVRLSLDHTGGSPTLKAPKRQRSYRTVELADAAVVALTEWRRRQEVEREAAGPLWTDDWAGLVFTGPQGRPQRLDTFRHALTRVMRGAHPHRLRHTYATHRLEAGDPIHWVAEAMGDTVATVESTYSHVIRRKSELTASVNTLINVG